MFERRNIQRTYLKISREVKDFLLSDKSREFFIFLFFFFVAGGFWLLQTLNNDYEADFSIPVRLKGVPNNVVITSEPASELRIKVKDKGTVLLNYMLGKSFYPVILDYADYKGVDNQVRIYPSQFEKKVLNQLNASTRLLSMKPEGVPQGLRKLQEEVTELNERLKVQTAKLYEFLAPQLLAQAAVDEGGTKYVAAAQEDCSAADARLLLNKLLADGRTVAAVVYRSGERINFVLGSGEQTQADCRSLCRKAGELFGGRGGGSQHFAQGGGAYSDDWRQKVLQLQQLLKK